MSLKYLSIALIIGSLFIECGGYVRNMVGMEDTEECQKMEHACREALNYKKETKQSGLQKDNYRKNMQEYFDDKCNKAIEECNKSQPEPRWR